MPRIDRILTESATLLAATESGKDTLNRPVWAWNEAGTLKCRGEQRTGTEVSTATGTIALADWLFFFGPEAGVTTRHRLGYQGRTFEVLSVDAPTGRRGAPHHLEALARVVG